MVKLDVPQLSPVAGTLFFPLYVRALETQRPDAMVRDWKAVALVEQLEYDFASLHVSPFQHLTVILRVRAFDRRARAFLAVHPAGVVVDIGCGLDTRSYRVDNEAATWYHLDLPEVMDLRRKLLAEGERRHGIAGSVLDVAWLDHLPQSSEPYLFLAEGVFPYLERQDVIRLVRALRDRFPGAQLVFDALPAFFTAAAALHPILRRTGARALWGLKAGREVETWGTGIRLLSEWFYFEEPEPRLGWYRLLRWVPFLGKGFRIVACQLGEEGGSLSTTIRSGTELVDQPALP